MTTSLAEPLTFLGSTAVIPVGEPSVYGGIKAVIRTSVPDPIYLRWVEPQLPPWLRVIEAVRRAMGMPRTLTTLNRLQDANEEFLHACARENTIRLTGQPYLTIPTARENVA